MTDKIVRNGANSDSPYLARVEAATVKVLRYGGQGVLIPGNMVLTAAHCVEHHNSGGMAYGDYCLEWIETQTGVKILVSVAAVEPRADIAVLEICDEQDGPQDHVEAFRDFCKSTEPVPICTAETPHFDRFIDENKIAGHILTHDKGWVNITMWLPRSVDRNIWVEPTDPIEGGTSGGPIVNENGQLVGICSAGSNSGGASHPSPHLALPVWVWRKATVARAEGE